MNAAVFSRWNGPGALTPSARKTARVRSSPIRRSVPDGSKSLGAYTSIIGIVVPFQPSHCCGCSSNSLRRLTNHVDHERRLREHRNVTAVDGFRGSFHPLRQEALQVRLNCPVVV